MNILFLRLKPLIKFGLLLALLSVGINISAQPLDLQKAQRMIENSAVFSDQEMTDMAAQLQEEALNADDVKRLKNKHSTFLIEFYAKRFYATINELVDASLRHAENTTQTRSQVLFYRNQTESALLPLPEESFHLAIEKIKQNVSVNDESILRMVKKILTRSLDYCRKSSKELFAGQSSARVVALDRLRDSEEYMRYASQQYRIKEVIAQYSPGSGADLEACNAQFHTQKQSSPLLRHLK